MEPIMDTRTFDVVISGISGEFPESENVEELEQKLMNKENFITNDDRKWQQGQLDVPSPTGKFKRNLTMDNNFFKISNYLFKVMDPCTTQNLKTSFEAICDAGVNPFDLSGSNTAVIMASFISETEHVFISTERNQAILGQNKSMQSNRISFFFNLTGPSFTIDASWNGGLQGLQYAYELIHSGHCSSALVGASNVLFGPEISYLFQTMGKLNIDGKTKSFSADADGYTRSEASTVFFLQRAEDAKRSYGSILGLIINNYGERNSSFSDFCPEFYKESLKEAYQIAKIDPSEVSYIEADGSATKKMDAMELNCIAEVLCTNRKTPLPVGSVKSNVGHTETVSSLVSITKALIALKTGIIPPNLHYSSPNPDVPALLSGQLKVITEPTLLNGNIVGVSSAGLAGSYGHIIIKGNPKKKRYLKSQNLPWLFLISGRTEEDLKNSLEKVKAMPFDEEFIRLSHQVFKKPIKGYIHKGYILLSSRRHPSQSEQDQHDYEIKPNDGHKRPVWFMFSGMGSQWAGMGVQLMILPTFAKAINLCHNVLLPKGIDLLNIINSDDPHIYDSILYSFVAILAIQIGLVDVLREIGIEPDGIVGHSVGELGCAYADGCFTAEQTILAAYARGKASLDATLIKGMMAAVGMGYNEIKGQLPPSIDVACHNSSRNCTLSGPAADMDQYIASIKEKGIFAKLVNVSDIAYHSRYIKPAGDFLLQYLKELLPDPKPRTKRWICTSLPESSWDSELAKYSSAEYHTNNQLSPVLFEEATAHIPERAIVIEIAPHGLLQSIVKQSLNSCTNIPLINKYANDTLVYLFKSIGKLYLEGLTINIDRLYPDFEYPVSANTPSITPLLTWEKKEGAVNVRFKNHQRCEDVINISGDHLQKYFGYNINGKTILSPVGIMWNVVKLLNKLNETEAKTQKRLLIEDVHFREQILLSDNLNSVLGIQIQKGSGNFDVNLNAQKLVLNGRINLIISDDNDAGVDLKKEENFIKQPQLEMNHNEIYKYYEELSIEFKDSFKLIQKISLNETGMNGVVLWNGEWIEFLDSLFMIISLYDSLQCDEFKIVHSIRQICIDFGSFQYFEPKGIPVFYNRYTKELSCEGLKIQMPLTGYCNVGLSIPDLLYNTCKFLPYCNQNTDEHYGQVDENLLIVLQNTLGYDNNSPNKLKIVLENNIGFYAEFYTVLSKYITNNQIELITAPSEDTLDDLYLNLEKQDNLLIVGELSNYKRALKCLKKVKAGFLLVETEVNIQKWNPNYPVFKLKMNNKLYTLYKTGSKENYYNLKNTINIENSNWKTHLKLILNNYKIMSTSEEVVYLFGRLQSLASAYKTIRFCHSLENSHVIRFIFYDDKSPPFSLDQPFYKEQIIKDLIINICINNTWGCLKLFTPHTKSIRPVIMDQQQLVYPLSSIKSENLALTALGLNLTDAEKHSQRRELGVIEYCGIDKSGNTVCGIGSLTDCQQLVEDKILRWEKVSEWSNEEAVSIPLYYAIAFYILRMLPIGTKEVKTVLVHNGTELVSQAIINVALSSGRTVFTTYRTFEERNKILQLFPKIQEDNIYLCESNSFAIPILTQTKYSGINVIVNTSNDCSILESSLSCLAFMGICCQINTEILESDFKIGMFNFFKCTSFYSIPTDLLLTFPTSVKEILQKEVEDGIKAGYVKPLQTYNIHPTSLNIDAIAILKGGSYDGDMKIIYKYFHNEAVNIETYSFICSAEKSYIIISDENNFFFDLIIWLIKRGAKTIHVLIEQHLGYSTKRLKCIMNNNSSVKISLHSLKILTNKEEMKNFLSDNQKLGEIFVVGQEMMKEVVLTDSILRQMNSHCRLICIGSGGETVCESRCAQSLPGLAISCQSDYMKSLLVLPVLDRFVEKVTETSVIFLKEEITNRGFNRIAGGKGKFPNDVSELLELSKKSMPKACFVEVMTSCPQYKYNKEVSPIFVIPGLKPNQMYKLTSRLFYPTFEARLPQDIDDIESVAKQLHEDLKRFKLKIFTLITNDWGGALGLKLATYLENDGKIVLLIMLESSPQTVQSWVEEVLMMGDVNLISKYVKLPYKVKKNLYQLSNWEEKVRIALENSVDDEIKREGIRNGLNILKNSLLAIMKYKANGEKFQGKYFMYIPRGSSQNDYCNITEFCKRKPVININNAYSHQDMLDDPEMARIINGLIPYEYKTAAHEINCEIFGNYEKVGPRIFQGCS